jgi:hypothetical protein
MAPMDIIFTLSLMLMEIHRFVSKRENLVVSCKFVQYLLFRIFSQWESNTTIEPQNPGLGEI